MQRSLAAPPHMWSLSTSCRHSSCSSSLAPRICCCRCCMTDAARASRTYSQQHSAARKRGSGVASWAKFLAACARGCQATTARLGCWLHLVHPWNVGCACSAVTRQVAGSVANPGLGCTRRKEAYRDHRHDAAMRGERFGAGIQGLCVSSEACVTWDECSLTAAAAKGVTAMPRVWLQCQGCGCSAKGVTAMPRV